MFKVWINDGTSEMPDDDILYVVSKEGIFLKKKLGLFESMAKVDKISILSEMDSYASLDIKKIPSKEFAKILALMKEVVNRHRAEVNTILHYNPTTRKYKIEVPIQEVSHGGVDYESDLIFEGYLKLCTIHSHADFSAFHSGTDKHDEETWDGLHMTVGHTDQDYFSLSAQIVANGSRFWVDPKDYINGLEMVEYSETSHVNIYMAATQKNTLRYYLDAPSHYFAFPAYWLDNISKKVYVSRKVTYHAGAPGLFDGIGNTVFDPSKDPNLLIPPGKSYSDIILDYVDENPCESCPYKDNKVDMLMEQYFESMEDDELEDAGFKEVGENDDGSDLDEKQEGY